MAGQPGCERRPGDRQTGEPAERAWGYGLPLSILDTHCEAPRGRVLRRIWQGPATLWRCSNARPRTGALRAGSKGSIVCMYAFKRTARSFRETKKLLRPHTPVLNDEESFACSITPRPQREPADRLACLCPCVLATRSQCESAATGTHPQRCHALPYRGHSLAEARPHKRCAIARMQP